MKHQFYYLDTEIEEMLIEVVTDPTIGEMIKNCRERHIICSDCVHEIRVANRAVDGEMKVRAFPEYTRLYLARTGERLN